MQHATALTTVTILLASLLLTARSQIPIPSRPPGFPYGKSTCNAPVQLESFMDLICSDSKNVYPTLLQVADHYGPESVSLNMLMFPLPYHRASYLAAQGTFVVDSLSNGNATYNWMKTMFDNQAEFYNSAIMESTESAVMDSLAKYAGQSGVDKSAFRKRLSSYDPSAFNATTQWKYGCSRGVSGTPFMYINGAFLNGSPGWSLDDWKTVIDPLLGLDSNKDNNQMKPKQSCPSGKTACQYLPGQTQCCLAGEDCIPNVGCRC